MAQASDWIAIVDDDPSVLKALRRSLRGRAVRTETYGSAQEFLAALRDGLPECLILDLQMPGMTGLELLEHLKREGIQIPSIVITAHGNGGVRKRCESAGAVAFLTKPFWKSSLHAAIDAAIGSARNGG
jgi:FixJ family two-component response regulator